MDTLSGGSSDVCHKLGRPIYRLTPQAMFLTREDASHNLAFTFSILSKALEHHVDFRERTFATQKIYQSHT